MNIDFFYIARILCIIIILCAQASAHRVETLFQLKEILDSIRNQEDNDSFTRMIDFNIMQERSINKHINGEAYFYTNNRNTISDLLLYVMENPSGILETDYQKGILKIFKDINLKEDSSYFFLKEPIRENGYDGHHIGVSKARPTNKVVIEIDIKNLRLSDDPLKRAKGIIWENAYFKDAYPYVVP